MEEPVDYSIFEAVTKQLLFNLLMQVHDEQVQTEPYFDLVNGVYVYPYGMTPDTTLKASHDTNNHR